MSGARWPGRTASAAPRWRCSRAVRKAWPEPRPTSTSAYGGAKHAIQGFTESVRAELLHDKSNVRITMVQLLAVNTPQFSWVLSRLPRHPQPVPPIYPPEAVARMVLHAADHPRRREYWVGSSTAVTLAPAPRWQRIVRLAGTIRSSSTRAMRYSQEIPWKP